MQRNDIDFKWNSKDGDSLLMVCCVRGLTSIVAELLTRPDLDVNFTGTRNFFIKYHTSSDFSNEYFL